MAAFVKFHCFVEDLAHQVHDLENDSLQVALTNTAPTHATDTVLDNITKHPLPTEAHGYSETEATQVSSAQTDGVYELALENVVFTAAGGTIGPFRYAILFNGSNLALIGYFDYGAVPSGGLILQVGETFTVDFETVGTVLTIE